MKNRFLLGLLLLPIANIKGQINCTCNIEAVEKTIMNESQNKTFHFDTSKAGFYKLSAKENRKLWYKDIENPKPTPFTKLWNDYAPNNYHAEQLDFCKEYNDRKNVELVFQFGPNWWDLWAFHIFVVKKIDCCYLITRSYFRHARFTYKAYSIIDQNKLDSFYTIINSLNKREIAESSNYCGYFVDNSNKRKFYVDFKLDTVMVTVKKPQNKSEEYPAPETQREEYKPEVKALFNFVDKKIIWTTTYD